MPYSAVYPTVHSKQLSQLWWLLWAGVFFVVINFGAWLYFDLFFLQTVGFHRMLNNPTENELLTLMEEVQQDSTPHIVLLGDSVVAGVGLGELETFTAHMQAASAKTVVNLAAPSESLVDQVAILQQIWKPEDEYFFFINPIWFQRGSNVLFPTVVEQNLHEYSSDTPYEDAARLVFRRVMPLYRSRDVINHQLLGIQPAVATRVALGRARAAFTTEIIPPAEVPNEGELVDVRSTEEFQNFAALLSYFVEKQNITFVMLDDQWFDHGATHKQSIAEILQELAPHTVINLQDEFSADMFMDRTHLNADGHVQLSKILLHAS